MIIAFAAGSDSYYYKYMYSSKIISLQKGLCAGLSVLCPKIKVIIRALEICTKEDR